jgi:hypothetical protein
MDKRSPEGDQGDKQSKRRLPDSFSVSEHNQQGVNPRETGIPFLDNIRRQGQISFFKDGSSSDTTQNPLSKRTKYDTSSDESPIPESKKVSSSQEITFVYENPNQKKPSPNLLDTDMSVSQNDERSGSGDQKADDWSSEEQTKVMKPADWSGETKMIESLSPTIYIWNSKAKSKTEQTDDSYSISKARGDKYPDVTERHVRKLGNIINNLDSENIFAIHEHIESKRIKDVDDIIRLKKLCDDKSFDPEKADYTTVKSGVLSLARIVDTELLSGPQPNVKKIFAHTIKEGIKNNHLDITLEQLAGYSIYLMPDNLLLAPNMTSKQDNSQHSLSILNRRGENTSELSVHDDKSSDKTSRVSEVPDSVLSSSYISDTSLDEPYKQRKKTWYQIREKAVKDGKDLETKAKGSKCKYTNLEFKNRYSTYPVESLNNHQMIERSALEQFMKGNKNDYILIETAVKDKKGDVVCYANYWAPKQKHAILFSNYKHHDTDLNSETLPAPHSRIIIEQLRVAADHFGIGKHNLVIDEMTGVAATNKRSLNIIEAFLETNPEGVFEKGNNDFLGILSATINKKMAYLTEQHKDILPNHELIRMQVSQKSYELNKDKDRSLEWIQWKFKNSTSSQD